MRRADASRLTQHANATSPPKQETRCQNLCCCCQFLGCAQRGPRLPTASIQANVFCLLDHQSFMHTSHPFRHTSLKLSYLRENKPKGKRTKNIKSQTLNKSLLAHSGRRANHWIIRLRRHSYGTTPRSVRPDQNKNKKAVAICPDRHSFVSLHLFSPCAL